MSLPTSAQEGLAALESSFSGTLLTAGSDSYDEVRLVHNGMIDRKPAVIARCRDSADISRAIKFATTHGLEISVRGGGHNTAGRAVVDDGLMIDLSLMKAVDVDSQAGTARVEGGVTWAEFNRATQVHGLATTGGVVGTTGVAGLTLGGGIGWLMSKYGLVVDNLLAVELVLADGSVVTVSADENEDLFWGLRGGGGNFGVASSFTLRLYPVGPTVTGGLIAWPLSEAGAVLRRYREFTRDMPQELTLFCGLVHAPDGSGTKLAAIVGGHCGSVEEGQAALRPLKEFGSPALDAMGPISYSELNGIMDDGWPKGALNYWKSSFLEELSDQALDTMVSVFEQGPVSMSAMLLEHIHGAVTRVSPSDTAFNRRQPGYNCAILGQWMDPAASDQMVAWVRQAYHAMTPYMAADRYVNYLGDDETGEAVAAAYGENFARLRELKRRYDPDNVFHLNQNIPPG